ncbi:UPF0182 family protein [Kitasatospora viridis]|uniref:UPF0182 family membrane protein n=1 Tax=Kitasatospora viridis TaxID=281105 RepID=UPI001FE5C2CD|nr:UPF0182 family protein [Kitasatospora viridis]
MVLLGGVALLALLLLFVAFAGFWTDRLWFRSVHYGSVFGTRLRTELGLFAVFGLVMAGATALNAWLAFRLRPPLAAMSVEQQSLDRYRTGLVPVRRWLLLGAALLAGGVAGAGAAGQWRLWLLWTNATPFGVRDGQFHRDVSFYAFDLPWYRFLVGFGFGVVLVSVPASALVHYLYGGLRLQGPGRRASAGAQGHLAVLLGVLVLLKAVAYWLDRYALAVKTGSWKGVGGYTGLRYVDANAFLPAKTILCCVALICAVLFFLTPVRRTWAPALLGFGLMVLSAVLIGGLYPAIVQQFQVKPNEQAKETPYLRQNIDATRQAYGIAGALTTETAPAASADAGTVAADARTVGAIRLLDPNIVSPTFQQLEQQRSYYGFPSTLAVDRYPDPRTGAVQDTVIGVRELDPSGVQQHSWINDHFAYTHGYGVVAAAGNQVDASGQPVLTESGLPATGALGDFQQRVYYGERTTDYAVVDGGNREIDYTSDAGQQSYQYSGGSGVPLDDPLTRAAFAAAFGQPQFLYSGAIGKGARVLYDRTPQQRVAKVAPWLTLDGDPYPVVEGGRLVWVLDGYTTSDDYPFSSRTTLADAARDSLGGQPGPTAAGQVNYIRDSVKATVDAYTGAVTLYQWDQQDPVLKTWMKAFPGTVLPRAAIPAALLPHLRYPQDLFEVQRTVLGAYHVTDPASFFSGTDLWKVPQDPTDDRRTPQPPYYLTLRMPGTPAADFSLTSTFVPADRDNLAAFLAVDSDPGPDYGTIRILKVAGDSDALGPNQAQSKFNADAGAAYWLNQVKNGGDSDVQYGNLLTLPVGGGFLEVEPVYVKGRGAKYPVLQKVLAVYGDHDVAFAADLPDALRALFGTDAGATPVAPGAGPPSPPGGTAPPGGAAVPPDVRKAAGDVEKAYADSQNALKAGDWTGYAAAQKELQQAMAELAAATGPGGGPSPAP